jgi:hypothetical protein
MKKEKKTINQIKRKLTANRAVIYKADKGNSIVITYQDEYHRKVMSFISNNNFTIVKNDLTKKFQRDLRGNINVCHLIIQKDERWKYVNLNLNPPTITGFIKIHKEDSPTRPIVN